MSIFPTPSPSNQESDPAPRYAPSRKTEPEPASGASAGRGVKIAILFGVVLALIGANVYLFYQLNQTKSELKKENEKLAAQLDKIQDASNITARTSRQRVQELQDRYEVERRQYNRAVGEAKADTLKKMEETKEQLQTAQVEAKKEVESHISEVRQSADTANTKVAQVGTEVTTVKGDLSATKSQMEKTISDLRKTAVDVDGHSVMIAKNGSELKALRDLGERNYVEFNLNKTKQAQKIGDVLLRLERTDPKPTPHSLTPPPDHTQTETTDNTG